MALGPDLWRLRRLQSALQAAGLEVVDVLRVAHRGVRVRAAHDRRHEAAPAVPDAAARGEAGDLLLSDVEAPQRRARTGSPCRTRSASGSCTSTAPPAARSRAGSLQLVTGSAGLDDWEWGVTLFAEHPDDLKEVVYKMRYDEASAVYAEFGRFITGMVAEVDEVLDAVLR